MSIIKSITFWVLYIIVSIVKLPFGMLGLLMLWVEKIHITLLARLVKWLNDPEVNDQFNVTLDCDAEGMRHFGEKWYLSLKNE